MANLSDYAEETLNARIFGDTDSSILASDIFVALSTTLSSDDGITEPATDYARVRCEFWTIATDGTGLVENTSDIEFAQAGTDWGTVLSVAIFDALTAGNMWVHGEFSDTDGYAINENDTFKISATDFQFTLA